MRRHSASRLQNWIDKETQRGAATGLRVGLRVRGPGNKTRLENMNPADSERRDTRHTAL